MTNEELRVHARNQYLHYKKLLVSLDAKEDNVKDLKANGVSESASAEIVGKHDGIILALSTAYHVDTNPNGYKSEQDAINSLKPTDD